MTDIYSLNALRQEAESLVSSVIASGELWAQWDASATSFSETQKSFLAKLTLEYMQKPDSKGKPMTRAEAETHAEADPRYKEHIGHYVNAREAANTHRVRYDIGRMRLELIRSTMANARAEINMSGVSNGRGG